jgi:ABC-type transport system involved in multi-copper enzyme maturation permease subunit
MLGPVFTLELCLAQRRGRVIATRFIYGGWWVLLSLVLFLSLNHSERYLTSRRADLAPFLQLTFELFLAQHFLFLFVATPAFVAGAITDEKSSGTLQQLLTSDLTSSDIVLGKFVGRMVQVAVLALVGWPFLCFLAGYCHIGLLALFAAALVAGLVLFVLGAASLWASVRSKQTRQAALRVYTWSAAAILSVWGFLQAIHTAGRLCGPGSPGRPMLSKAESVLRCLDPFFVADSVWRQDDLLEFCKRFQIFLPAYISVGVFLLILVIRRIRPFCSRQWETVGGTPTSSWMYARREVDDHPVCWHEAECKDKLPRGLAIGLLAALSCVSSAAVAYSKQPTLFLYQGLVFLLLASLVAGVRTSGVVSGERECQTWDSLLLTPLDTWDLILDKANGALDSLRPYLFAYAVPAALIALWTGVGALVLTLSMLLLTWAAVYYMAATGILYSVRSKSSWRSLVATLINGYSSLLGILCVSGLVFLAFSCCLGNWVLLLVLPAAVTDLFALGITLSIPCLGMSWLLLKLSFPRLDRAKAWVDQHERSGGGSLRSLAYLRLRYDRLEDESCDAKAARTTGAP